MAAAGKELAVKHVRLRTQVRRRVAMLTINRPGGRVWTSPTLSVADQPARGFLGPPLPLPLRSAPRRGVVGPTISTGAAERCRRLRRGWSVSSSVSPCSSAPDPGSVADLVGVAAVSCVGRAVGDGELRGEYSATGGGEGVGGAAAGGAGTGSTGAADSSTDIWSASLDGLFVEPAVSP